MENRASVASFAVSLAAALILGIYEVNGWSMPMELAVGLVAAAFIALAIGILVLLHLAAVRLLRVWGLRSPFFRRDRPKAHQWLLDIAEAHAEDPGVQVKVLDARIERWDLDPANPRPSVSFSVDLYNGCIHGILCDVSGGMTINGERLPEDVRPSGGGTQRIEAMSEARVQFKQHVTGDLADGLLQEIDAGKLAVYQLNQVILNMRVDLDDYRDREPSLKSLGGVYRRRE